MIPYGRQSIDEEDIASVLLKSSSYSLFISIIFYVFAIIYRNPINKPDCISNKLCLKKKHKFKKNK